MSILLNKLLTGELQIFTSSQKKDNNRTIQNKIKKTIDKKARQCNRTRSYLNFVNNLIDNNKKEVQNDYNNKLQ